MAFIELAITIILSIHIRSVLSDNCEIQLLESICRQHPDKYPDCSIDSCSSCEKGCDRLTPECVLLHSANWCINFPKSSFCPTALPPPPANALAPSNYSRSIGATVTFSCNIGYSGSPICSCTANSATTGVWSGVSGSCVKMSNYCQVSSAPSVPVNAVAPNYDTTINGFTTYSCSDGYSGAVSITCLPDSASFGIWSAISGFCSLIKNYCPASLPTAPANVAMPNGYALNVGATATYSCAPGYSGSPTCSCMANSATSGNWSPVRGSCTEISDYCKVSNAPPVPANAATPIYNTRVNGVTTYSCNLGYSGSVYIRCLPNSTLSGDWSVINGSCFMHILLKILVVVAGISLLLVLVMVLVALVCIIRKNKLWCHSKEAKWLTQIRQRAETRAKISETNLQNGERPEIDGLQAEQCIIIPVRKGVNLKEILSATSTSSSSASESSSSIQIGQTIHAPLGTIDVPIRYSQPESNSNLRQQRATDNTYGFENVNEDRLKLLGSHYSPKTKNVNDNT